MTTRSVLSNERVSLINWLENLRQKNRIFYKLSLLKITLSFCSLVFNFEAMAVKSLVTDPNAWYLKKITKFCQSSHFKYKRAFDSRHFNISELCDQKVKSDVHTHRVVDDRIKRSASVLIANFLVHYFDCFIQKSEKKNRIYCEIKNFHFWLVNLHLWRSSVVGAHPSEASRVSISEGMCWALVYLVNRKSKSSVVCIPWQ